MSKHLLLDVVELANKGGTPEQIAAELNVTETRVRSTLRYARKKGVDVPVFPRKERSDKGRKRNGSADEIG